MSRIIIFDFVYLFLLLLQIAFSTAECQEVLLNELLLENMELKMRVALGEIEKMNETICSCDVENRELRTLVNNIQVIKANVTNLQHNIKSALKSYEMNILQVQKTKENEIKDILQEILIKQNFLKEFMQAVLNYNESSVAQTYFKTQLDDVKQFFKRNKLETQKKIQLHDENLNYLNNKKTAPEVFEFGKNSYKDGVYLFKTNRSKTSFCVYCIWHKQQNWLIIQRREDGSQNFFRNWDDYKKGFGDVFGEYWIGLDRLHAMTNERKLQLLILMEDYYEKQTFAIFKEFSVGSEIDGYRLNVKYFSPANLYKNFLDHNGMKFSTYERDNDNSIRNCARDFKGAWWYHDCFQSNLNGQYFSFSNRETPEGIVWGNGTNSLRRVIMAVRESRSAPSNQVKKNHSKKYNRSRKG